MMRLNHRVARGSLLIVKDIADIATPGKSMYCLLCSRVSKIDGYTEYDLITLQGMRFMFATLIGTQDGVLLDDINDACEPLSYYAVDTGIPDWGLQ